MHTVCLSYAIFLALGGRRRELKAECLITVRLALKNILLLLLLLFLHTTKTLTTVRHGVPHRSKADAEHQHWCHGTRRFRENIAG